MIHKNWRGSVKDNKSQLIDDNDQLVTGKQQQTVHDNFLWILSHIWHCWIAMKSALR